MWGVWYGVAATGFAAVVLASRHRIRPPVVARRLTWLAILGLLGFAVISVFFMGRYIMLLPLAAIAVAAPQETGGRDLGAARPSWDGRGGR